MKKFLFSFLFLFVFSALEISGALIDNRYLPLYRRQFDRYIDRRSGVGTNIFFLTGDKAIGDESKEIGIPEINGKYDLIKISKALQIIGQPNPLKPEWRSAISLEPDFEGKITGQGFWLGYEQNFLNNLSIGLSWYFLGIVNRQRFFITNKIKRELHLTCDDEIEFDSELRKANNLLGLSCNEFSSKGMDDLDLYLRLGTVREYFYKFKRLDLGVTIGALFPTGPENNVNNPVSIPLGGNGHWGIYGMVDATFELKEDLIVGLWLEFLNRFAKTQTVRMPINGEPQQYGAIVGPARIEPGFTIGASGYVAMADIRDGFGFQIRATGVYHLEDEWKDSRCDQTIKTKLNPVIDRSSWIAQYITFSLLYDFTKTTKARKFAPLVYLDWDMPVGTFFANNFIKTNRISFGFEFNF